MLIFIDESGDLGLDTHRAGTSSHFVVTAVACDHRGRKSIEKAVRRTLKNKIRRRREKTPAQELKGARTSIAVKQYLWSQLDGADFEVFAVVLDKRVPVVRASLSADSLYDVLVEYLLDQVAIEVARPRLDVEIDGSKGRAGRERFNERLRRKVSERVPENVPHTIRHMKSEQSSGIQLADVISWGVLRRHRDDDREWYDVISDRIVSERTVTLSDLG